MTNDWTLDAAGKREWKQYIVDLRQEHTQVSLVVEMGLKETATSQLSRFTNGDSATLKRWFESKPGRYIEPFAAALKTRPEDVRRRFQLIQAGDEPAGQPADWHPAFPGVSRTDAVIEPVWRGQSLDDLKAWHTQHERSIRVIGLPGSGRRTLVEWLCAREVSAEIGGRPARGALEPGTVQSEAWAAAQVGALAQRLAHSDGIGESARAHLAAFEARLKTEPALAGLVEDPQSAIELLAHVAQRGVPDARTLREELLRREWDRFRREHSTGWATLVQADTIDAILLEGFCADATDRQGWLDVIEIALPSAVSLADLQTDLEQMSHARGAARKAATDRLKRRLVGWSAGSTVDALIEAGWLMEDDVGLHVARLPLALSRMARRIHQSKIRGWFARCGHRPEAMGLVRECAVWGMSWGSFKRELHAAPEALTLDIANAAIAFVANMRQPIGDDSWFTKQWAIALWAATAGYTLMGENLGPLRWGIDSHMHAFFQETWASGRDLVRLSKDMAGILPQLSSDDRLAALGRWVPPAARSMVDLWCGAPFPPQRVDADEAEQDTLTDHARHVRLLAHLAPAQCIPADGETIQAWHLFGPSRTHFLDAWERAAQAGDEVAIRHLAMRGPEPLRWLGQVNPDEAQLADALMHLELWRENATLTSKQAVTVLGRFPEPLVAKALLERLPGWPAERSLQLLELAHALENRPILQHFADMPARCAAFDRMAWRRRCDAPYQQPQMVDAAQPFVEAVGQHALRARQSLHALGDAAPLREWALNGLAWETPQSLADWRRVAAGAAQFHYMTSWDALDACLPDDATSKELLAEVTGRGVFADSPFADSLTLDLHAGKLQILAAIIRSGTAHDVHCAPAWRWDTLALRPLVGRPAGADGPRALLGAVLMLWRRINVFDQPNLVRFLASQIKPPAKESRPHWLSLDALRREAIDTLVERQDAAVLEPLFAYEDELKRVSEHVAPVVGRIVHHREKEAIENREDGSIKRWILSRNPPQRVRDWLVPPSPAPWVHEDAYFTAAQSPAELFERAFYSTDPRAEPMKRTLQSRARESSAWSAELYWSIQLDEPLDDLASRWLTRAEFFVGPGELQGQFNPKTGEASFAGGWLCILATLVEANRADALLGLVDTAPTKTDDPFARLAEFKARRAEPDAPRLLHIELTYDDALRFKQSAAHALGAALSRVLPSHRLFELGRPTLERLGLGPFWQQTADSAALLALLSDPDAQTEQYPLDLMNTLGRRGHAATFEWLERALTARTDWRPVPSPLNADMGWERQMDTLLRWHPAGALRVMDQLEQSLGAMPMQLIYELAPWADHPGVARRLRRWMLVLARDSRRASASA